MECVKIRNTDLSVSRLSLGTASIHHLMHRADRRNLIECAIAQGITHFDTSPLYGFGLAELDLGSVVGARRAEVTIATKIGLLAPGRGDNVAVLPVWVRKVAGKAVPRLSRPKVDWSIRGAEGSLNASLRRLGTDYVDLLLLHEPDFSNHEAEDLLHWLQQKRSSGKIRYWGLAGLPPKVERWVVESHPLAAVIQTRDSIAGNDAAALRRLGCAPQFTYGYLSGPVMERKSSREIVVEAIERNRDGSIIVSTRRIAHIVELAKGIS